ncbi:MAG: DoxX family protein [Pyrinomonadaceae bacterium]
MTKIRKIAYWVSTIWLALGMTSTAIVQLIKMPDGVEAVTRLGYPSYLLTILGVWKIFGVVAVLIPGYPKLKEWAYAGFFFAMSGAAISHIIVGDAVTEIFPSLLLLILTVVSWYSRPDSRKIA